MPVSRSRHFLLSANSHFDSQADLLSAQSAFSLAPAGSLFKLTTAKATTAILQDGLGDIKPTTAQPTIVTSDTVPNSAGPGDPILTVDAAHTISTIDTIGDQDFYQVTLVAGQTYQIGMYGYSSGPNAAPNADSYIEIYAADGTTLIVSGDGGANTPANMVNSGFDVLLTYTPDVSGTYYINARAFDQDPTNGTTGDGVGDYELFVHDATTDPSIYRPYYDVDSPLYAIDWGTRVNKINQTAANPDGNEGPRPTGNPQGTPTYGSALDIPALAAAQGVDITGKNVVTIYFAKAGDIFTSVEDPTSPGLPPITITATGVQDFEHLAVVTALAEFSKVADVVYLEVQDRTQADFIYTSYQGTPGPGVSLLGSMEPPDEPNEGLAAFNSGDARWNARDLAQGGFSFVTLIHEFGHGHGLAHPHDNGGHSGIMHGVQPEGAGVADYTTGDFDLNQSVFTMMSYEDGWQTSPYGNAPTNVGYGYLGGLMAFDIAAIQDKYGVNEDTATGNDVYMLKDVNAAGTYYTSIWDAGGTDEIKYVGTRNTSIDLRPATLQYEYGGGGWVSYAYGIFGGYTIANGVTIEKATTDAGNDTIHDNAANNILSSGGGNDFVYASMGGIDAVDLGSGNDIVYFGAAFTSSDMVDGGGGYDTLALQGDYSGGVALGGNVTGIEAISFVASTSTAFGDPGTNLYDYNVTTADANFAAGLQIKVNGASLKAGEDLTFNGSAEHDASFLIYGGMGADTLTGGDGNDIFFFAENGRFAAGDHVTGGPGYDGLFLRGNYNIDFTQPGYAGAFSGIENITLTSASDARYARGGGSEFDYHIVFADALLATGATLTVNGGLLQSNETMDFNGSNEAGGMFRLFGGAADDVLIGGGGNDVFRYQSVAESTIAGRDGIQDFTTGDKIDLSNIDAITGGADDAFTFIGTAAFGHHAGELQAINTGGNIWQISADVDGDGNADLQIIVVSADNHAIGVGDFVV